MALDDYPDVLTVEEARQVLGVSKNTIYKSIRSGLLPSFKAGERLIRISKERLREFINEREHTPQG